MCKDIKSKVRAVDQSEVRSKWCNSEVVLQQWSASGVEQSEASDSVMHKTTWEAVWLVV